LTNFAGGCGQGEIRGARTAVRPAHDDDDADLLVRWHADPDVARYSDDETFTHAEMLERLRRRDFEALPNSSETAGSDPTGN
jgi:hypothetical protein